jgi:glycosyltransferase involved in cell wall biosynthesis
MTTPISLVHVVPRLSMTGPVRSIAAGAKYAARLGLGQHSRVVALERELAPAAVLLLRREGVELSVRPGPEELDELVVDADLVLVHFWNCPSMFEFLLRPLPPARVVAWIRMQGLDPPQVVPDALVNHVDDVLLTTPVTRASPALQQRRQSEPAMVAPGIADMDRLEGFRAADHDGVVVGYVGTVNAGKLHPRFVELCAAVDIPDARFVVYGAGGGEDALRDEAAQRGIADRFELKGHTEDLAAALAEMDVFGYPLRPDTYASSEKSIQEAMWVGIPPVVFPFGGVRELVRSGVDGLVAENEAQYVQHLERLATDAELRARLGAEARRRAREVFDPGPLTARLHDFLARALDEPKRPRQWPDWGDVPAGWFARALGPAGAPFLADLAEPPAPEARRAIASLPFLVVHGEGGLAHWRNHFPDDEMLDEWCRVAIRRDD